MNTDPARIAITVMMRYAVVIICSKIGLDKAETEKLLDPEVLMWLGVGAGTLLYGVYASLRSKMKQNIALELPATASLCDVNEIAKEQPIKAVLKTKPAVVTPKDT